MAQPWAADIPFDDALAARLIAEQFPDLAGLPLRLFGEGWDNRAYRLGATQVARFPRRRAGIQYMQGELAVLPHLAGRLPLPIPAPTHIGRPTAAYDAPFAVYPYLPGVTLDSVDPPDAARHRLAAPLGRFLAALHAHPPPADATIGEARWVDADHRMEKIRASVASVGGALGQRLQAVADAAYAGLAPGSSAVAAAQRTLIHGDLYARHLLLDDAGALVGIIDWGDVHQGDAAVDLGVAFLVLPPADHAAFRAAYGPIEAAVWARARMRAVWDLAVTLQYSHEAGDPPMERAGLRALGWLEALP